MSDVIPGIDVYLESLGGGSRGGKVGLLANVASLTRDGCTTLAALRAAGANVTVVFAPEHGYFGLGRAGENMANSQVDGLPIASLYGESFGPPADLLRPPSAVLVDLQDTGNRWYTYLGTVANLLQVCARTGTPVIVLDRPNPQGGDVVEGPLAEPAYFSLVAPAAMPARYGLTIGESALMINREIGAALGVTERTVRRDWEKARLLLLEALDRE
ncbi:MAG TPA: exo-beta-N-acetylmuramidase NamZ domain-containing protein [Aggregatilineales bacterium]|nr:exo-beta-N-acetylmuramidase NamZ domain-containing protein [Aggregatilineales bacterium]